MKIVARGEERSVHMNKPVELRALRSSEAAARKIVAIAYGFGEVWDGRLFVEKLNWATPPKMGLLPPSGMQASNVRSRRLALAA